MAKIANKKLIFVVSLHSNSVSSRIFTRYTAKPVHWFNKRAILNLKP